MVEVANIMVSETPVLEDAKLAEILLALEYFNEMVLDGIKKCFDKWDLVPAPDARIEVENPSPEEVGGGDHVAAATTSCIDDFHPDTSIDVAPSAFNDAAAATCSTECPSSVVNIVTPTAVPDITESHETPVLESTGFADEQCKLILEEFAKLCAEIRADLNLQEVRVSAFEATSATNVPGSVAFEVEVDAAATIEDCYIDVNTPATCSTKCSSMVIDITTAAASEEPFAGVVHAAVTPTAIMVPVAARATTVEFAAIPWSEVLSDGCFCSLNIGLLFEHPPLSPTLFCIRESVHIENFKLLTIEASMSASLDAYQGLPLDSWVFLLDWVELQPWPPPMFCETWHDCATIRPKPWPFFILIYVSSMSWDVSFVWKPPWPFSLQKKFRCQLEVLDYRGDMPLEKFCDSTIICLMPRPYYYYDVEENSKLLLNLCAVSSFSDGDDLVIHDMFAAQYQLPNCPVFEVANVKQSVLDNLEAWLLGAFNQWSKLSDQALSWELNQGRTQQKCGGNCGFCLLEWCQQGIIGEHPNCQMLGSALFHFSVSYWCDGIVLLMWNYLMLEYSTAIGGVSCQRYIENILSFSSEASLSFTKPSSHVNARTVWPLYYSSFRQENFGIHILASNQGFGASMVTCSVLKLENNSDLEVQESGGANRMNMEYKWLYNSLRQWDPGITPNFYEISSSFQFCLPVGLTIWLSAMVGATELKLVAVLWWFSQDGNCIQVCNKWQQSLGDGDDCLTVQILWRTWETKDCNSKWELQ